jgi:hypothetical protein
VVFATFTPTGFVRVWVAERGPRALRAHLDVSAKLGRCGGGVRRNRRPSGTGLSACRRAWAGGTLSRSPLGVIRGRQHW